MVGGGLDPNYRDPYPGARMGLIASYTSWQLYLIIGSNLDGEYQV